MDSEKLPRILIVEDDQTFRETVCEILRDVGYKVRGARSLKKASKRLTHHEFDIVLSDINLGNHTGFEVLQVAHKARPDAKIMMMSSRADPELVQQALGHGAERFLEKPFRVKELLQAIEGLLQTSENETPAPQKPSGESG
jgi:DNA-binding response OmpR family regulator